MESYNLCFVLNGNNLPFISDLKLRDELGLCHGVLP